MGNEIEMRIIKISAGMSGEFELIRTNAPDDIIENQLIRNTKKAEECIPIHNPYVFLEKNGYSVEIMGCQDDFSEEESSAMAYKEFDYYKH